MKLGNNDTIKNDKMQIREKTSQHRAIHQGEEADSAVARWKHYHPLTLKYDSHRSTRETEKRREPANWRENVQIYVYAIILFIFHRFE